MSKQLKKSPGLILPLPLGITCAPGTVASTGAPVVMVRFNQDLRALMLIPGDAEELARKLISVAAMCRGEARPPE
jgi:hypothetical protein